MNPRNQSYPHTKVRILCVTVLFTLGLAASLATAQQPKESLPTVTAASVPFYAPIARMARIQGLVQLRVSTDGERVSSVEVVSGPPLLARLASDNVKTWEFKPHAPTTFEVAFHYKLMLPSNGCRDCKCEYPEKESVLLEFPTDIYLTGKTMMTCDPVENLKDKRPATVHLKVVEDGRQVAAPAIIKFTFDGHSLQLLVRDDTFQAPPELLAAPKVILETDVADSHIRFVHVTGFDFTFEDWTLRLAEHTNVNYYDWPGPKGADIPSSCMLEFESVHRDPGRGLFEQNCRTKKD